MDHDQRFKVLLTNFFREFFLLLLANWVDLFDFTKVEWLDKELFINPPQGEKNILDLVAKLPVQASPKGQRPDEPGFLLALIHVEIESRDSAEPLRAYLYQSYEQLRRKYHLPVLSIAFYLNVGLNGLGWDVYEEKFLGHVVLHFEYPYIGLPALKAEEFVTGENVLGVALAALMRIPEERRAELRAQAWKRLLECPENEARRLLLCECVEAYWTFNEEQQREYEKLMTSEPYREVQAMAMTMYEKTLEQQRETHCKESLLTLLEERFGTLPPQVQQRLTPMPEERYRQLLRGIVRGYSLRELGLEE